NAKRFLSYEAEIRALVETYAAELEGRPEVDLVEVMTYDLPARVIFLLMGIPDVDTAAIKRWADKRLLLTFGRLTKDDQMEATGEMLDYWNYCKDLVAARLDDPKDDYPSALIKARGGDDTKLTINEINCLVFGILLAGHETTTNSSTNIIRALLMNPGEWDALVADPSLIPNAVEEGLRYATSVVNWRRVTREEVEIAGVKIPAGANILLALTSANRDESLFENPDKLDVTRQNARKHIAFGHGIHMCIGAPLARLQLKIILETLTKRFPNMTLSDDRALEWIRTIAFRGPTSLPVRPYGPAGPLQ
ncbi:MAG: cytochrome P450, partial [Pseudomonadota bacterium]